MLLTVLQECSAQKSNDADVLLKIPDKLSTWKQNEQSTSTQRWQPPQTHKTANQVSRQDWQREWPELPRTKQSHQQTVPDRRANSTVGATIAGFNDTEWTMPLKLTQKRKALEVLTAGQELEANLIPAQTFDDYLEIRDLCRALRIWPPVTVLIEHIGRVDTGKLVQVAARRGHGPMKPMSFVMMHLTYDELCPQPIPSVKVDLQSQKPPAKTTSRITAPSHYRKSFLPIKTQDDIRTVISEIATWQKGPLSALTGGTWAWSTIGKSEQLVGHLRVSPERAKRHQRYLCHRNSGAPTLRTSALAPKRKIR